jgi:hypothetical protein
VEARSGGGDDFMRRRHLLAITRIHMNTMRYYSANGLGTLTLHGDDTLDWSGFFGGDLTGANLQIVGTPTKGEPGRFDLSRLTYPVCAANDWPRPSTGSVPIGHATLTPSADGATLVAVLTLNRVVMGDQLQFSPPPPPTFTTSITLNRLK